MRSYGRSLTPQAPVAPSGRSTEESPSPPQLSPLDRIPCDRLPNSPYSSRNWIVFLLDQILRISCAWLVGTLLSSFARLSDIASQHTKHREGRSPTGGSRHVPPTDGFIGYPVCCLDRCQSRVVRIWGMTVVWLRARSGRTRRRPVRNRTNRVVLLSYYPAMVCQIREITCLVVVLLSGENRAVLVLGLSSVLVRCD